MSGRFGGKRVKAQGEVGVLGNFSGASETCVSFFGVKIYECQFLGIIFIFATRRYS